MRAPVRARAERAWGHGERVVAVPQHATRRCGGRAGMVWRWARERGRAGRHLPASHGCRFVRLLVLLTERKPANDARRKEPSYSAFRSLRE